MARLSATRQQRYGPYGSWEGGVTLARKLIRLHGPLLPLAVARALAFEELGPARSRAVKFTTVLDGLSRPYALTSEICWALTRSMRKRARTPVIAIREGFCTKK